MPNEILRTLETDILSFTQGLPYWSQFLSEKLLSGVALTDEDHQAAYQYFLEDAGLSEKTERPDIAIICKTQSGYYKDDLKLLKISGVTGINALVQDQVMTLGPNLTIIYGANGSGKSGYIRLLNNVFITKGDKTILPNVHDTGTPPTKAAEFTFESGGTKSVFHYPTDCGHAEFKQFSVFDEKAVQVHLNNKNQFNFRPAGLSFFADLNEAYKNLEELAQADIDKHASSTDLAALFDGESNIKNMVADLSAKSKIQYLKALLPFTAEDKAERTKLEGEKAALTALKKDKEIQDLLQQQTLLASLKTAINSLNRYFTIDQLTKANDKIKDCVEKELLAASHDIDQFKKTSLGQIGGAEWRAFIAAADVFARLQDKGGVSYPEPGDSCLLCQQPLTGEAVSLVSAYWAFIKSKAEQDSKDAQAALATFKDALGKLDLNVLPDTGILYKWLSENKAAELALITAELQMQLKLRDAIIRDISDKKVVNYQPAQINTAVIDLITEEIGNRIKKLKEADVAEAIEKLQKQITVFNHKEKLGDHISTIEKVLENLVWTDKVIKAKSKISKRDITTKEKALSGLYFNQAYIDRFNAECVRLKGAFGINITHTGSAGTSFRQLSLKGRQPSDVLSEGEQKVISLADFLSETILSGINKGIIFDDPVNSLDEKRKSHIAERLIEESANRQIVVFTHDLVFVSQLITYCQDNNKQHICHWIEQRDGKPGYISLENAPSYEKDYRNQNIPIAHYTAAKKPECSAKDRETYLRDGFTSLRTCYEVLVINGLFKNVVQRFNERVSVDTLKTVNFDIAIRDEISSGFYDCCKFMEGHSHSDGLPYRKPELEDLNTEVQRYITIRAKVMTKPKA
ncbi:AAA domain-containing protein [Pedobacter westerhofensis]|uniref:AAA domain-containing protein n=1 Tax=Pedobacter westerhofensis TaxID=425512 RepID=A0A521FRX4_9SPHI|nr:AAA family ATPase [Pedobacter westerhofensis]SMO98987.1 AAA domain-containing protein [Pedobacter westerhofensis]